MLSYPRKMRDLDFSGTLRFLPNSKIKVKTASGENEVSLTELQLLDGLTATTAELNILDGVTATAAELNILDGVTSTAAELNILDGVTATAAELNQSSDVSLRTSTLTTTADLEITDSDKTIYLDSATAFVTTLPTVASSAGVRYTIIVKTPPGAGAHTIVTDSSENFIHGSVMTGEDAAGSTVSAASGDTISFTTTSITGDRVNLECDGTNWYVTGFCNVQDGIATSQAS